MAHITHLVDPIHNTRFSSAGRVTCPGEIFLERIEKSDEESIANGLVRFLGRGKFGQDLRWDRIARGETQFVLLPAQVHINYYDIFVTQLRMDLEMIPPVKNEVAIYLS